MLRQKADLRWVIRGIFTDKDFFQKKDKKLSPFNIKSLEKIQKIVSLYLFETFLHISDNFVF